jgi:hypothetical protein
MHVRNKPPATRRKQKREVFPREDAKTAAAEWQGDHCHGSARAPDTSFPPTLMSAYSVATPISLCSSELALSRNVFTTYVKEHNGHSTAFSRSCSSSGTQTIEDEARL